MKAKTSCRCSSSRSSKFLGLVFLRPLLFRRLFGAGLRNLSVEGGLLLLCEFLEHLVLQHLHLFAQDGVLGF